MDAFVGEPLIDAETETVPPPLPTPAPGPAARVLLGVSLVLVAFNLRPCSRRFGGAAGRGARSRAQRRLRRPPHHHRPVLCLGLFAPFAPGLAIRFGAERVILGMLLLLALGTGLRGLPSGFALLFGSMAAGAAIAVGNVLLPGLVKRDFSDRPALMTGLFTMALCGGAAVAAGVTVPIERAVGSWNLALASWTMPALLVAALWSAQRPPPLAQRDEHARPVVRGLWRDPLAWQVTLFMGLQSALAYCVFGWLAPILMARGMDPVTAGLVVSVSVMVQTAASLAAPALAVRFRDQRGIDVVLVGFAVAGLFGCLFAPLSWVWGVGGDPGHRAGQPDRGRDDVDRAALAGQPRRRGPVVDGADGRLFPCGGGAAAGRAHPCGDRGFEATAWLYAGLGLACAVAGWGRSGAVGRGAIGAPVSHPGNPLSANPAERHVARERRLGPENPSQNHLTSR